MTIADLVVLTVYALKVTVGKEDVADPVKPTYYRFFSPVNTNGSDVE